ncbi:hypothetical protein AX14_004419 [Amanita brunnescens Koide BX004]|nr:hypothetical protein AX14_004419 [Amanita brunnescens Koide BX004]
MSTSHECPFWIGRTSKERHAKLYAEIASKFPAKNKPTGWKKVGFSAPGPDGFSQVGTRPGIAPLTTARIDVIPSGPPSPIAPDSVKPALGSILGALADDTLRPELRGNEEARKLMQETLLDEAAFAAADAADNSGIGEENDENDRHSMGSPPLKLSYA